MKKPVKNVKTSQVKKAPKEPAKESKSSNLHQMAKSINLVEAHNRYDLPMNQYGAILEKAMLERNISIKDLASELRVSYEHVRQLVRGGRTVGPLLNRNICEFFELDEDEMERVYKRDQMLAQYGEVMSDTTPKDAILRSIENGWPLLTEKQRELIAENVSRFAFQNRAHGTFGKEV